WSTLSPLDPHPPGACLRQLGIHAARHLLDVRMKPRSYLLSETDIAESPPSAGAAGSAAVAPPTAGTPAERCRPKGGSRSSELDDVAAAALLARSAYRHG